MALAAVLAFADVAAIGASDSAGPVRYLAVLAFSAVGGLVPATLFTLAIRVAPTEGSISTTIGWMQQWSAFGQFCGPPIVAQARCARAGGSSPGPPPGRWRSPAWR